MTRETKIGLLVGLAFIIVIGILLSDHLTSTTEPPQAQLVQAGKDVRASTAVPGGATAPVTQVQVPQVTPQSPVATKEELQPKQQPIAVVQIGPANTAQKPATPAPAPTPAPAQPKPEQVANTNPPAAPEPRPEEVATNNSTLQDVANTLKEPVVPIGTTPDQTQPTPPATPTPAPAPTVAGKSYKAEAGDNLSKIATKVYGTSTKALRQLIIDANPTLKANPDMIVVGKTYTIPPAPAATAQATATPATPAPATPVANPTTPKLAPQVVVVDEKATKPQPTNAQPATNEHFYVVKSGETLIRIAREQLGNGEAWHAIAELNKLTDPGKVVVGQKLRMPAKPVTVAQSN